MRCAPLAGATHQGEDDEQLAFRAWRPWRTGVVLAGGGDLGVGHRWQGGRGRSDLGAALHACAAASGARSTHAAAEGWVEGWAGPAQQQGTARQVCVVCVGWAGQKLNANVGGVGDMVCVPAAAAACRNADKCSSCGSWSAGSTQQQGTARQVCCVCVCGLGWAEAQCKCGRGG
jgi:hypothetical protein